MLVSVSLQAQEDESPLHAQEEDGIVISASDTTYHLSENDLKKGERLFYGLMRGQEDQQSCVSCHNVLPADTFNWNPSAIAIAEIVAVGKPAIFIPLPSAAEDHQTKNAMALVEGKAAIMIKEGEAKEKLPLEIHDMLERDSNRLVMIQNLKKFKHPDATEKIVEEVIKMVK